MTAHCLRHAFQAMGSRCELLLHSKSASDGEHLAQAAVAEVRRLESKYSRYRDDSVVSAINRVAAELDPARRVIDLQDDDETCLLLDYADTAHANSDGLFDITTGVYRQAWDFSSNRLPDAERLRACRDRVGWEQVRWQRPRLRFTRAGMELDFGGFVKEYAVDRVVNLLRAGGVSSGYVDLGGDIGVLGPQPDGSPWHIGVRHPRAPQQAAAAVDIRDAAIASSGDYERFMIIDGVRYCHILQPATGQPVRHFAAVSVIAPQCLVAGTCSTVAMLMEERGLAWLQQLGLPYVAIAQDGRMCRG